MNQYLEKIAAWHPDIFNKGSASQIAQAKDSLRLAGEYTQTKGILRRLAAP